MSHDTPAANAASVEYLRRSRAEIERQMVG
jgi:hypothetical protein